MRRDFSDSSNERIRPIAYDIREWIDIFNTIVDYIFENESQLYTHGLGLRVFTNGLCGCFLLPCICYSSGHRVLNHNLRKRSIITSDSIIRGAFDTINQHEMIPFIPVRRVGAGDWRVKVNSEEDKRAFIETLENFITRFEATKTDGGKYYTRVHHILHDAVIPVFSQYYFGNRLSKSKRTSTTYHMKRLVRAIIEELNRDSDSDETPRYSMFSPRYIRQHMWPD